MQPRGTLRSSPSTAVKSPNRLTMPDSSMTGSTLADSFDGERGVYPRSCAECALRAVAAATTATARAASRIWIWVGLAIELRGAGAPKVGDASYAHATDGPPVAVPPREPLPKFLTDRGAIQ